MATFSGLAGTVTIDVGVELNVRRWTIEETARAATGGHSDASGWTQAKAARKAYTGSFDFYQDETTIQPVRGAGIHTFTFVDGHLNTYLNDSGDFIVVTSVSYSNDIETGELVTGTVTFVGEGALIITNA